MEKASWPRAHCAADVAERVSGPAPVELVDGDNVGQVQHVYFLELRGSAELGRHNVNRNVGNIRYRRTSLPDARSFNDDEVEPGRPAGVDHERDRGRYLGLRPPGGQRAKEIRGESMAFILMRSPSRAPPPRRRVGSMARTAMRNRSPKSSRNLLTTSSVRQDLPEPPSR